MAKVTIKGKKVKGTKKKDKITWLNKKEWKKALTVNAGAGNDVINFTKSKYKNVLNGEAGNDVIKGGKKNDKITGGKGNDTIYTGKGTNTVVINKGDGNDTIYHQGTKTVIKVNGAKANDTQAFEKKGNDLLLTYTHGGTTVKENLTFKNYYTGNKNIFLGSQKLENLINAKGMTITGSGNITGTDANDTISASVNNDTITAGKGNDVINAGKGSNIIYHNAGDGNDIIVNSGGSDTLVFNGVNSKDDITATLSDNDVVLTAPNGETVTLQNALTNAHSVEYVQIGNNKYSIDNFKNHIQGSYSPLNGTDWHDDINATSWSQDQCIYAGAGNDNIHILISMVSPDVYVGAGNDTISLDADLQPDVDIYFENGDGNNTLIGLNDSIDESTNICLYSDDLIHSINLGNKFGDYRYISGTMDGNNLILNLTNGETFTIDNYYGVSDNIKNVIKINNNTETLSSLLHLQDNIVNLTADLNHYDEEGSNKLIIAPEIETARDIAIMGDNNELVVKGKKDQTVYVIGNNSTVYAYNTGEVKNEDVNNIYVNSNNNHIYANGADSSTIRMEDNLTGNYVQADEKRIRLYTSKGGSTTVNLKSENPAGIVYSYGDDNISGEKGVQNIHLYENSDKTINLGPEIIFCALLLTSTTENQNIKSANVTRTLSDDITVSDLMFTHYDSSGISTWPVSIDFVYTDINDDIKSNGCYFEGRWDYTHHVLSLDNSEFFDKVTITCGNDNNTVTKTLSQMTQYVDMDFYYKRMNMRIFDYDEVGTLIKSAKGYYFKGSTSNETYDYFKFTHADERYEWGWDYKNIVIDDVGGNDTLNFDMGVPGFFFDVKKDGNGFILGDDLIFTNNLSNFLSGSGNYNTITIKNGFGTGKIETITIDDGDYRPHLNYDNIMSTEQVIGGDSIWMELTEWLTTGNGKDYSSVSDALATATGEAKTAIVNDLTMIYSDNTWSYWTL